MDLSRYQLERVFQFVAGIIPGLVALVLFQQGHPWLFKRFVDLEFVGYKTKVAIIVLVAFVVGNTVTAFCYMLLSAVGGAIGGAMAHVLPYKSSDSYSIAPWRDSRWRILVKGQLGANAPNDTHLMSQEIYDLRSRAVGFLPEAQRPSALTSLAMERNASVLDDMKWERWYDHYHTIILRPEDPKIDWFVRNGLNFNLEIAALYVLTSAIFLPSVRHWWWILPACCWVFVGVMEACGGLYRHMDRWSTLADQIKYLATLPKPL